ncbi:D-alanyl-D-alanine carboxypeptidase (penicillin-binding protein 5/6) [Geomicrobium halophilum]|uniref:serine-type D-Ala-D-Ala carboxypeptidase n=1 Tax=Geomicrobium halophilum TaxID=549000 RepID=A0A841PX43_9BACL|nr:D-alanyl-D-alanine carboxypeptidase family protein [Geomicrobium halophilum]MBB6448973.1 D-alanyl-D-alanine carboxypeptidase (penicillin-binding protein 5/6) [Geomicrobium halophilum]
MNKKAGAIMLSSILLLSPQLALGEENEDSREMAEETGSAILMEVDTGQVLFSKDEHESLPPASMTKIMTMLLIMEDLASDDLTLDEMVTTSERAASMGGSQIFLETGEEMSVRDMLKAIAVASGNDASVAMAEHMAGSEDAFVERMNGKAEELGLDDTTFYNSNGLPVDGHESSAHDLAVMSQELLKYEEITTFTGIEEDYLRQGTDDEFWLVNTNRMLKFFDGLDGLKTGFTNESKYGLAATAKRDDMRLVAVVMGAETPKKRNADIAELLNYGFANYQVEPMFDEGAAVTSVPVEKGTHSSVVGRLDQKISLLLSKEMSSDNVTEHIELETLEAPIEKGEVIGKFQVQREGEPVAESDIIAGENVESASWWELFKRSTLRIIGIEPGTGHPSTGDET